MKMRITDSCRDKIKYLCSVISSVEWSGVLLYNVLDKSLQSTEIEVVDFYPVHKGTVTHTDFEYPTDVFQYMMDNDLMECKQGLIHSHNNMEVFFSGEDIDELNENADKHNLYVSLIVNNRNQMTAKAAHFVSITTDSSTVEYLNWDGEVERESIPPSTKEAIYLYDFAIEPVVTTVTANTDWLDQVTKINVTPKYTTYPKYTPQAGSYNLFGNEVLPEAADLVTPEFVKEYVLGGRIHETIATAANRYKYEENDEDEIILLYDQLFGASSVQEESSILGKVVVILTGLYSSNNHIKKLIKKINANIASTQ